MKDAITIFLHQRTLSTPLSAQTPCISLAHKVTVSKLICMLNASARGEKSALKKVVRNLQPEICIRILQWITVKGYSELKISEVSVSVSSTLQTVTLAERNVVTVERWKGEGQEPKLSWTGFVAFDNHQPLTTPKSTQLLDQLSKYIAKFDTCLRPHKLQSWGCAKEEVWIL